MGTKFDIDPAVARELEYLREQPGRDPRIAKIGREVFLAEAKGIANPGYLGVTPLKKGRQISWNHGLHKLFQQLTKERSPMFSTIGTVLLILAVIFGGSGATLAAAQNSQPDQTLYGVKTWSEDIRTDLTNNDQARIQLELDFANRRAEEMRVMLEAGELPPQSVQTRMLSQIDIALQLAARQPDDAAIQALEQIRDQLRTSEQLFLHLQERQLGDLSQVREKLQDRLQLCEDGLKDPDRLRERLQERDQLRDGTGANPSGTPVRTGTGYHWATGTPTPGAGFGPGEKYGNDEPQQTRTLPAQNQFGQTKTVTPGGGNGGNPTPNPEGNGNGNPTPDPNNGGNDNGNPPPTDNGNPPPSNNDGNGGGNGGGTDDGGGNGGGNGGKGG